MAHGESITPVFADVPPDGGGEARGAPAGALRAALLRWYDANARRFAWRRAPGAPPAAARSDPYAVWLSEIMLQQTTTTAAAPYFEAFLERWPTVRALAAAEDADVMRAWAGLGYYARARNLLLCARAVVERHEGAFPSSEADLRALPGVGPYTAAAIAAIAFDQPANVVDGNVERVMSRLHAVDAPLPDAKKTLAALAGALVGPERPGDYAQALMDLGATLCVPRTPRCGLCPIRTWCRAAAEGDPAAYPRRRPKAARPTRRGVAFVILGADGVALESRPSRGLLGGMQGLPLRLLKDAATDEALDGAPISAPWRYVGEVRHVFTHFTLDLQVFGVRNWNAPLPPGLRFVPVEAALSATPTLFSKAIGKALAAAF